LPAVFRLALPRLIAEPGEIFAGSDWTAAMSFSATTWDTKRILIFIIRWSSSPIETAFKKIYEARPLLVFASKSSMTNFVNLYGNDYPSMKLIYPALRGGVESGPEDVPPGRTGAAR
jgi:hypothetical protein